MKHSLLLLLLALPLPLRAAAAQAPRADAPTPFVGVAVGASSLPAAFAGCTTDPRSALEAHGGLSVGSVGVEARGAMLLAGLEQCQILLPEEQRGGGMGSAVEYPFPRGDGHATAEIRVRYAAPSGLPLMVTAGAGWLAPQRVPYLVSSTEIRTRGSRRFTLGLDHSWFRVPYDVVVREVGAYGEAGPALSSGRHHDWRAGLGVRLGVGVVIGLARRAAPAPAPASGW